MRKIVVAVLFAAALSTSLYAQTTPEQLTVKYFQLLQEHEWEKVAALFAPDAKASFRSMMSPLLDLGEAEGDPMLAMFFGDVTREEVTEWTDDEFFAGVIGSIMQQAMSAAEIELSDMEVLGAVDEGTDVRHVVIRTSVGAMGGFKMRKMEVVTVLRTRDGWGLALSGELEGMAAMLQAQLGAATEMTAESE